MSDLPGCWRPAGGWTGTSPPSSSWWQGRGGSRKVFHPVLMSNTQSWCVLGTLLAQVVLMYKHGGADVCK